MKKIVLNLPFDQKSFVFYGSEHDRSILKGIESCSGYYETHVMSLLKRIIQPNSVCLDIGANIGAISLALSYLIQGGYVYSFEPSLSNYSYLHLNILENHLTNMEAVQKGAYDQNTKISFFDIEDGGGWSYVPADDETSNQVISCVRIDDWVVERGIARLDFIKMDIEGSEIKALNGALATLHKWRPDLIIEYNIQAISILAKQNPADLFLLLKSIYPAIYLINHDLLNLSYTLTKIESYQQFLELIHPNVLGDLYCTFK